MQDMNHDQLGSIYKEAKMQAKSIEATAGNNTYEEAYRLLRKDVDGFGQKHANDANALKEENEYIFALSKSLNPNDLALFSAAYFADGSNFYRIGNRKGTSDIEILDIDATLARMPQRSENISQMLSKKMLGAGKEWLAKSNIGEMDNFGVKQFSQEQIKNFLDLKEQEAEKRKELSERSKVEKAAEVAENAQNKQYLASIGKSVEDSKNFAQQLTAPLFNGRSVFAYLDHISSRDGKLTKRDLENAEKDDFLPETHKKLVETILARWNDPAIERLKDYFGKLDIGKVNSAKTLDPKTVERDSLTPSEIAIESITP